MQTVNRIRSFTALLAMLVFWTACSCDVVAQPATPVRFRHVLLISVDGMHASDLAFYVRSYPGSALAELAARGVTYTNASTSWPSDSFPGLLAMTTGGSPSVTGVFYDNTYDRNLSPPGSHCAARGSVVLYNEDIDRNTGDSRDPAIDPGKLPLDPRRGCTPVYPHTYLRVNTIFNVVRRHGGLTAWADKHPAYDILNGPNDHGVAELYTPEIGENAEGKSLTGTHGITGSVAWTIHYDATKVHALLNEIHGLDPLGTHHRGIPELFGMNFQALNVAQKLPAGGYHAYGSEPSADVLAALRSVDHSIGELVAALKRAGLDRSTLVIVSAKSGNSPMNRHLRHIIDHSAIANLLDRSPRDAVAHVTSDDLALIWLQYPASARDARALLMQHASALGIAKVYSGTTLLDLVGLSAADARTPDLIVQPRTGVIYAKPGAGKIAEHGGFARDDTHVALLIAAAGGHNKAEQLSIAVSTQQIAPTILAALGINPAELQAVRKEHTPALPALPW